MPFQKGHKLSPGRKLGSKNKKNEVLDRLTEMDFDVLYEIVQTCRDEDIKLGDRLKGLIALAEFIYPKKKAVEVFGNLYHGLLPDEREDRKARIVDLQSRLEVREVGT